MDVDVVDDANVMKMLMLLIDRCVRYGWKIYEQKRKKGEDADHDGKI